ncbi:NUT family member 2G-like [Mesoplodon densirostris]|uniref:NUT family member 2G-like n=1 Tax=Mesoplodon densirostris TaxID=48708 RepID=UPI0028DD3957|nr:NUT family member 2G-like [Mesoplodon densirostris]
MTRPSPAGRPLGPHPPRSRMRSCLPEQTAPADAGSPWRTAVRVPESPAPGGVRGPSAVLGTDVPMNPGASLSTFTAASFPPPMPGAQHRPPWEQHLPPLIAPAFPPGSGLLLPAFPRMPLVANGGRGPSVPGACNLTVRVRSQGRPVQAPQTQTFIVPRGPLSWSAPGALSGSAACPAPIFLATPAMETIVTAPAVGVTRAGKGGWTPGFPPQAPPPAAQMAPNIRPVNSGPWPRGTSREDTTQPYASQEDGSDHQSVDSDFRRRQRLKPLARRHLPQSPDAEALSCFLIPVPRSLACLKPTMTLEEGLCRAVQEWQHISNSDRIIYYKMAQKFMDLEAEEEMQVQPLQWMQCAQGLPPPAPPKLDPRGPPAPKVGLQPATQVPTGVERTAFAPRMSGPRAQPSRPKPHRSQRPPEPKAPEEIPPEAVREYVDIMEALVGPVHSATGDSDAEWGEDGNELQQEEDGTYSDPDLLSYIDKLCSQEDFVTKVEAVIHPGFLADLLSPDPQLDLLALEKELEQEERLTLSQLVQKRLLALKEDDSVRAAPSHSAPGMASSPSESDASQGGQRHTGSLQGPRDASLLREASPVREARGPRDGSSEDEEELSSLAFLSGSLQSLLPFWLSQSPVRASSLASPGGWGAHSAPQSPSPQRRGLSPAPPAAPKSRKWALCGRPAAAEKLPIPGAGLGFSGRPALALGLARPSQPRKRKRDPFVTEKRGWRKKKPCSQ